jgi:hypothetical protein
LNILLRCFSETAARALLNKRNKLKNKGLAFSMFAASISVIILFPLQDVDYFIGLWPGMKGDFDLEKSVAVPFFLGTAGILASFC